jgi:hypothetical protein
MNDRPTKRSPVAGGAILAMTLVVGAIGGAFSGQPTLGLLIGLVLGGTACGAIWWRDRG